MKPTGSARKTTRSRNSSTKRAKPGRQLHVVCVKNGGYVDLEPLKIYRVRPDAQARTEGFLRIVDDSGEDYLYPATFFKPIHVPPGLFKLVGAASR